MTDMTLPTPSSDDLDVPSEELRGGLLPIREVTRQTGVNSVTLRAWERRYGLIVPHRTPKGHRLYTQAHVDRVLDILTWLNRGVSVGQVKQLLDTRQPPPAQTEGSDWHELRTQLIKAINELAERRLDDLFNQSMSLYPPRTMVEQLLLPLVAELNQLWNGRPGSQMERAFFYSWLRSKFGARLYHNNRSLTGQPVLLINQSDLPIDPHLWLTAWLVSSNDCPVEVFDLPLSVNELVLACERLRPRALMLYASTEVNVSQLPQLLAKTGKPVVLAGAATDVHQQALVEHERLLLAKDPLQAHSQLRKALLF